MKSLEQILSGGAEAAPEAASEAAGPEGPPPDAGDGPGDGPAGDTPEGDPEAGAPAGPEAGDGPDRMVPVSALIDERRKRRAAEERLVRREEAPAGAGPRAGVPRFRDDPEGYVKALEGAIAAEISAVRVDAAESAARARYPDFDAKARAFARQAAAQPGLVAAMQAAPDPAEFAYRMGARVMGGEGATGGPDGGFPESLSESPSAQGPAAAGWRPKTLSEIVGG